VLKKFTLPPGIRLVQYVDDLLLTGEQEEVVEETTIELLNFLAKKGLRVSEKKAQLVGQKVKCLGHILTEGLQCIDPERIQGVLEVPLPKTKKELQQFL
ncbi:POL5 protein, partial [Stercorarius parasiticus]|nr:POL5 protein [Stercorarius parasiticus]